MSTEQQVVDYLTGLKGLEPEPIELAKLRGRRRRRPKRARRTLTLALAIVAASSALAAATGVIQRDRPMPRAKLATISVPEAVRAHLEVFTHPAAAANPSAFANLRTAEIGTDSIRAIDGGYVAYGRTRFDGDGVIVAVDGIGFEGPYPLEDITAGRAWGYTKRTLTAITADDVTRVDITYRDKTRATFVPHDNVVIGRLTHPTPIEVVYVR